MVLLLAPCVVLAGIVINTFYHTFKAPATDTVEAFIHSMLFSGLLIVIGLVGLVVTGTAKNESDFVQWCYWVLLSSALHIIAASLVIHLQKRADDKFARNTASNATTPSGVSSTPSSAIEVSVNAEEVIDESAVLDSRYGSPVAPPRFEKKERLVESKEPLVQLTRSNIHQIAEQFGYTVDYSGDEVTLQAQRAHGAVSLKIGGWITESGLFMKRNLPWEPSSTYTKICDAVE